MIDLAKLEIGDVVYLNTNDGFEKSSVPYRIVEKEGNAFIGWNDNMEISDYIEEGLEGIHTDYPLYEIPKCFELIGNLEDAKASYENYQKHREEILSER